MYVEFLKLYFDHFAYQSIDTSDFLSFFRAHFAEASRDVDFDSWLRNTGACPTLAPLDTRLVMEGQAVIAEWRQIARNDGDEMMDADKVELLLSHFKDGAERVRQWDSKQKQQLLTELLSEILASDGSWWDCATYSAFARLYEFDKERNSEMQFLWYRIGLRGGYEATVEKVSEFVSSTGRMKFVRPLFSDLHEIYPRGSYAKELFAKVGNMYHEICKKMIGRDLGVYIESSVDACLS